MKVKKFFAVQFANNVPEYSGTFYDTEEEALKGIKEDMLGCYNNDPFYVFELKGTVQLGYESADNNYEPWRKL